MTEINGLTFRNNMPTEVTLSVPIETLARVTKVLGEQPGDGPTSEFYSVAVGCVFNRYWDAGIDGYFRGDED